MKPTELLAAFTAVGAVMEKFHGTHYRLDRRTIQDLRKSGDESQEFLSHLADALEQQRLKFRGNLQGYFDGEPDRSCTRVFLHRVLVESVPVRTETLSERLLGKYSTLIAGRSS